MTTIVLGCDPGTVKFGYGIIELLGGGAIKYIECGVLAAPKDWSKAKRLRSLTHDLAGVFADATNRDGFPTVEIACEAGHAQYAQAAAALGEARGIVIGMAGASNYEVALYPPTTVKKAATGNGSASKAQVARMVAKRLGLKSLTAGDAADALAVCLCHTGRAILQR